MDNKKEKAAPQHIDNHHPTLWKPEQVAKYFGISLRTVYNRTRRGAKRPFPVKPIRIGRALRWDPEAIMEFVKGGGNE